MEAQPNPCSSPLRAKAIEGLRLFNEGKYFDAHEALEFAWREEENAIRDLYRGLLQAAVICLHITRGNLIGAEKVYERSHKWLRGWSDECAGIDLAQLCADLDALMDHVRRGVSVDRPPLMTVIFADPLSAEKKVSICDRCGSRMIERQCKVTCPNCGNRFDCSDLNIYFD
jgi:hypothetical protein